MSPNETSQTESEAIVLPRTRRSQEIGLGNAAYQPKRIPLDKAGCMPDGRRRRSSRSSERLSERAEGKQKIDIFNSKDDFLSSTVILKTKPRLLISTTSSEEGEFSSPVPPSYKSTIVEPTLPLPIPSKSQRGRVPQTDILFTGKKIITAPKERVKPAVDLDEAWKNIKMEQDEKFADEYRDNLLSSRCWDIWKQGYIWVMVRVQVWFTLQNPNPISVEYQSASPRGTRYDASAIIYAEVARSHDCSTRCRR